MYIDVHIAPRRIASRMNLSSARSSYFHPLDDVLKHFSPVSMDILREIASRQPRHMLKEAISGTALNLIVIVT